EQRIALEAKAQADFDRVRNSLTPKLSDAAACIQSQAALLPVAQRESLSTGHYRKGYCSLASALITRRQDEFSAATVELEKAIESWPARSPAKNRPPEPLPSGLRVLSAIATLQAGADESTSDRFRAAIASAGQECSSPLMGAGFCEAILRVGRHWLGWI